MNTIREVEKINQEELDRGIAGTPASWHSQYRNSPWVYVGNLDHQLTEGDTLCVMSQFGEIEDINLARDEDTGKSRGFAFVKYEDARSCILAVDNLVGIKLCGRSLRVDHMEKYRLPKKLLEQEEAKDQAKQNRNFGAGHAYKDVELANKYSMHQGQDLFSPDSTSNNNNEDDSDDEKEKKRRKKEEKKQQKEKDKMERRRKKEEHRIRKEEERRQHRSSRYRHDTSDNGGGKDKSSSTRDHKEERRKDRKRKHRREDSEDRSAEKDRRRHRNSRSRHRDHRHDKDDDEGRRERRE